MEELYDKILNLPEEKEEIRKKTSTKKQSKKTLINQGFYFFSNMLFKNLTRSFSAAFVTALFLTASKP